ncbi:Cell cycle checkpoint protein RAD17 [Auxenochlorella protothecoides]|uniref:Cell cycle checkpoint protein RAD17 n=1 Tax=Auxenochlorella protothecoides TaxID=3075 RepID=A0A087SI75_AUXPR|nr:Cell cycle checkpoint protein RAD17 [Auxenochlorella protothecoides]KFM25429.1 Cell cycle checkpoint protein RAD17 [Auxenochlorella protothecoides]
MYLTSSQQPQSGPPGCGKSTLLRVLAQELGFNLVELQPAAASGSWEERATAAPGESYQSRLSAFEESLLRIRMPVLSLSSVGGPGPPRGQPSERPGSRLTVVADLPLTPDPGQARRLVQALVSCARHASQPLVICGTEVSGRSQKGPGAASEKTGLPRALSVELATAGVPSLSLNPITAANCLKVLRQVLQRQGSSLAEEQGPLNIAPTNSQLRSVAESCGGDLSNALATLRFCMLGASCCPPARRRPPPSSRGSGGRGAPPSAPRRWRPRHPVRSRVRWARRATPRWAPFTRWARSCTTGGTLQGRRGSGGPWHSTRRASWRPATSTQASRAAGWDAFQDEGLSRSFLSSGCCWRSYSSCRGTEGSCPRTSVSEPSCQAWRRQRPGCSQTIAYLPPPPNNASPPLTPSGRVSLFLHENLLEFAAADAMEDVAASLLYLSDSDVLGTLRLRGPAGRGAMDEDALPDGGLAPSAASSVAGQLYAQEQAAPATSVEAESEGDEDAIEDAG